MFLKFFEFLNGSTEWPYSEFLSAFRAFKESSFAAEEKTPQFMANPGVFLQFLYDLNVISYIERADDRSYIKWCFRERSYANISPKVKEGLTYQIFYGLTRALNVGRAFRSTSARKKAGISE